MADIKRKLAAKEVVDVRKPGKTAADSTSKPIIVTNRQIIRDPMVTTEATSPVPEVKTAPDLPKNVAVPEATVVPVEEPIIEGSEASEPVAQQQVSEISMPSEQSVVVKRELVVAPPKTEEPEATVEAKPEEPAIPSAVDEPTAEPASTEKIKTEIPGAGTNVQAAEDAAEEAEAKRQDELLKLAENKQYFLPINAVKQRRAQQYMVLGITISLMLILAWVNIALDAGLIELGSIQPVTNFFSN